jgi:SAM-dependent methyltransferase
MSTDYLDAAAAAGSGYKSTLAAAMDIRHGHAVLDLGCGPGIDLRDMADHAGPAGSVIGVDHDPEMLAEAARRLHDHPRVSLRAGDAHHLPLRDASVDRARTDRVLQHVRDPAAVLAELHRVLRPGGLLAMAEPDWDTLTVSDEDISMSRAFARFVAGRVAHCTIGRQLVRLAPQAGLRIRSVEAVPVLLRDFDTADRIFGLRRNTARAVRTRAIRERDAAPWLARLEAGPMLATTIIYLVTASRQVSS